MELSKQEYRAKNQKSDKFYKISNRAVAEEVIKSNRYLYFTTEEPHWKYKNKIVTVWNFEFSKDIFEDVKKIKDKLFGERVK